MKDRNKYFKQSHECVDLGYEEYINMFEEGYTDTEISRELGINEDYIKHLREEYQNDY